MGKKKRGEIVAPEINKVFVSFVPVCCVAYVKPDVDPSCPPEPCARGEAGIHNVLARFGVGSQGKWASTL